MIDASVFTISVTHSFVCVYSAKAAASIDLTEMFPGLVPCVYKFVKEQRWNQRITLVEFFAYTNRESRGGASLDATPDEPSSLRRRGGREPAIAD